MSKDKVTKNKSASPDDLEDELKSQPLSERELEEKVKTLETNPNIEKINQINNQFNSLNVDESGEITKLKDRCTTFKDELKESGASDNLLKIELDKESDKAINKILFFYCSLILKCLELIEEYKQLNKQNNYKIVITTIITKLLELIADYQRINKLLQDFSKSNAKTNAKTNAKSNAKSNANAKTTINLLDQTDIQKTIFYFIILTKQNIEEFVPSVVDIPKRVEFNFPYSQQLRVTIKNKRNGKNIQLPIRGYLNSNPNSNPTLNPGSNQLGHSKSKKMTIRSKYYSCSPTLLESVLPVGYKTFITIKGDDNKYYKVSIPKGLKPGTKIFIEQPKVAILDVGQSPPYCNIEDKALVIAYYKLVDLKLHLASGLKYSSSGFKFTGLKIG